MHPPETQQYHPPQEHSPNSPPNKANLKAWWNHFTFVQKPKKDVYEGPYKAHDTADHPVFGKTLKESLHYASVQISTANANGDLYVWGYIPVVVAKCGLYLKENATEVPGTFRVNGSNRRMRELQAAFETPPRYGKNLDWKQETYTTHDVASVFRRYLTQMPEPVIPYDMYHFFRDALAKQPFNQEEVIATYKSLIRRMPRANQYLLLYVLDLLSVFARKCDKNLMTATNLAVIFRPGLIAHPEHEMSPQEHALSQKVLEFLIAQQDWFMLDIAPPPPGDGGSGSGGGSASGSRHGHGSNGSHGHGGGGGKWREGANTPSRRGTGGSAEGSAGGAGSGGAGGTVSAAAWNSNAEAGPSMPRQRTGSGPAWYPGATPAQAIIAQTHGQLTEQISPPSSGPPSPTAPAFPRTRSDSAQGPYTSTSHQQQFQPPNPPFSSSHPYRPSSPLNPHSQAPTHAQNAPPSHLFPKRNSQSRSRSPPGSPRSFTGSSDVDELMFVPSAASAISAEEDADVSLVGGGGWKLVGRNWGHGHGLQAQVVGNGDGSSGHGSARGFLALGHGAKRDRKEKEREKERIKMMRRRTTLDQSELPEAAMGISPISENPSSSSTTPTIGATGVTRSRTLPSGSRRTDNPLTDTDKENETDVTLPQTNASLARGKSKDKSEKRVLKKQRRTSGQAPSGAGSIGGSVYSTPNTSPMPTPGLHVSRMLGMPLGREREGASS